MLRVGICDDEPLIIEALRRITKFHAENLCLSAQIL